MYDRHSGRDCGVACSSGTEASQEDVCAAGLASERCTRASYTRADGRIEWRKKCSIALFFRQHLDERVVDYCVATYA